MHWDARVELPERLIVEILRAAEHDGATVVTRCRAVGLQRSNGRVTGVELAPDGGLAMVGIEADGTGNAPMEPVASRNGSSPAHAPVVVHAPLVINASGPWADGRPG